MRTGVDVTRVVVRGGRAVGVVTADGTGVAARRAVVADVAPTVLARDLVGEHHLPGAWLASLRRHRWTSGYFRLDVDLDGPVPWADDRLADSAVVHVTGDLDELAMSQAQVRRGPPARPAAAHRRAAGPRPSPNRVPGRRRPRCGWSAAARRARSEQDDGWPAALHRTGAGPARGCTPRGCASASSTRRSLPPLALQERDPNLVGGDVGGGSASPDQLIGLPARGGLVVVRAAGPGPLGCAARRPIRAVGSTGCAGATPTRAVLPFGAAQALGFAEDSSRARSAWGRCTCQSPAQGSPSA